MDIRTPMTLQCATPLSEILDRWGPVAVQPYHYTPLDFVERQEWIGSRLWTYYVNILRNMRIVHYYPPSLPIRNFSSLNFPPLDRHIILIILLIAFSYTGIFVAGWNLHFPTSTERTLWRICSLGTMIITVIGGLFESSFLLNGRRHSVSALVQASDIELISQGHILPTAPAEQPTRLQSMLQNLRNNTPSKDPYFDIPIRSLLITTPICALYCIFRAFILIEDLITLRQLPASAFAAIDWSTYVPHI